MFGNPKIFGVIALLVTAGAAVALWQWLERRTYHFAVVQAGVLYRDGNRGMAEFSHALRRAQARTVVALVDDREFAQEQFQAEERYCRDHGIALERLVIVPGGWPTQEQVREFLRLAGDKERQPVLVHCAQGVRRTGIMVAAFEESILGYDARRAKEGILSFGHSQRTVGDIRAFIDAYDGPGRRVGALPAAKGQE